MSERRGKYNAKRTEVDGRVFASKAEALRYSTLAILETAGEIKDLACQVPFPVFVNGKLICHYYADFTYHENRVYIVEDVKGVKTAIYRLKKKLVEALYNITITETK
jgi:hypothetical protein